MSDSLGSTLRAPIFQILMLATFHRASPKPSKQATKATVELDRLDTSQPTSWANVHATKRRKTNANSLTNGFVPADIARV